MGRGRLDARRHFGRTYALRRQKGFPWWSKVPIPVRPHRERLWLGHLFTDLRLRRSLAINAAREAPPKPSWRGFSWAELLRHVGNGLAVGDESGRKGVPQVVQANLGGR